VPCPDLPSCELPAVLINQTALERWQWEYCHPAGAYRECERWKAVLSGCTFPRRMFPNGFVPPEDQ